MPPAVRVHLLPALFDPAELTAGTAVIIDVLRASTTIIQALASGARRVIPCGGTDEAQATAARISTNERLLGGERHGRLIPGFDLDNSPRAYTPERVAGRTLVFTTTNGTQALRRAQRAEAICIAAFVNLSAAVTHLAGDVRPLHLVCAGTDGQLTAEDILLAGLLAFRLSTTGNHAIAPGDIATELAIDFARQHGESPASILAALERSRGGLNLLELGWGADIAFAAQVDALDVVPVWDRTTGELTPA
jgi:2-phosphosulfolactate phosphatase